MLFSFIWSILIFGFVFWGIKALGIYMPWQLYVAIGMFLFAPFVSRIFRPEPRSSRRRR
jgi:glucose dehydrogenase